jgi:squamous cell carcinoma antigen recognized by T-cells 3
MGHTLELAEESNEGRFKSRPAVPPTVTGGMLVPRTAGSRPRAGLGYSRKPVDILASPETAIKAKPTPKSQDEFRKMLG